jgi:asparagine synthase (glutamine-hydrolysing)
MKSDEYYIAELEDKILDTVYLNTKDIPRPWGVLLSGGFDSGLLAALLKPDYIFRVKFPYGTQYDESRYAEAIIEHLKLDYEGFELIMTKELFEENFNDAVRTMGEPTTHFSLVPFYTLMKEIGEQFPKCKTIFSGEGPDEYLGGYARYIVFDELKKLYEIPELRSYHSMINKILEVNKDLNVGKYHKFMNYDKPFHVEGTYPQIGYLGKMDMELGGIEKMEQRMAKAHSVNLQYPYIDIPFAEYCYDLPDHLKIRNGVTKWAFRQVCKKYLPAMMMDRSKMGGPVAPVNKWLGIEGAGFDKTVYIDKQKEILGL